MFAKYFPKQVKDVANNVTMILGKDQNTFKKIIKRAKRN